MFSLIVTLVCAAAFQMWTTEAGGGYTYYCYPNNTITISSLPTGLSSMNYFAIQSDGTNCSVSGNQAAGTAEITGCDKDLPIYFTFSTYSGMLSKQIHGGEDVEVLNITCYEIDSTGVLDSVSETLGVTLDFADEADLNVTYDIASALNVSSADVGDAVEWTITFPLNYTLEITSCTAYPGTGVSASNSLLLITNWCSDEDDLITDFDTNSMNTVATAVIQAFKFYDYDNVYLECDLKVCPPSSSSCVSSCTSRKKRSAPTFGDDSGAYKSSVGRVLHINTPDASSATQWSGVGLLMTVLTTMLCLLL